MNWIIRALVVRLIPFALTLGLSLGLTFAHRVYVRRQAVFISSAWEGRVNLMRLMYACGVDVNKPACAYRSCVPPLIAATGGGSYEAVQFLLDSGADVNAIGKNDATALMVAALLGHDDTVTLLLSHGAAVNTTAQNGDTALSLAQEQGRLHTVELLRRAGAKR